MSLFGPAPKKSKKISLNEFLGDSTLGSWADEMESLPNAPAPRIEEESSGDRYGRRDDFLSSRRNAPPREDVPLPTQPPFTAFVGNLAFDLTESELESFFSGIKTKSVKIIRDKDEKPKGFGYIEFEDLDGLKEALGKTGSNFSGRTIRVSVAEPPKERGFGAASEDNAKFDNPWRRDGPLPDLPNSRDASRRRFDGPSGDRHGGPGADRQPPSVSDNVDQWRSNRPPRVAEADPPPFKRKGSGFLTPEAQSGAADKEETWTIGAKFKASSNGPHEDSSTRSSTHRVRNDMGPPKETHADEGDWRSSARGPKGVSPNNSTPPTPQLARKKLELLPRSGSASVSPSPLSSPKMGPTPPTSGNPKSNPFGAARPVDVSSRDKEVAERLEREREAHQEKFSMSRSTSRTGIERSQLSRPQTPPVNATSQPKASVAKPPAPSLVPNVRPTLSFANAAAKKEPVPRKGAEVERTSDNAEHTEEATKASA
ncbi:putative eukaryotic translation initiation factor 4H [Psilocybe cubensis]|uniref:Eukaryotic translation initiation factor 4H n=2 Tax=Psilocybe cubensis TaxID=181762 RepID=A0ACB8H215_PSICU|nr:putative eukaryotic translation initiation factor 4H [Psilocybe cubensis]KAH9481526.1 putative eukaryotic translation initiation factor 4H [Psilocybe cubensis]